MGASDKKFKQASGFDALEIGDSSPSMSEVDAAIYGEIPASGRVIAKPLNINDVWADVRQPRRAIPAMIRLHWDGNPGAVPALLDQWYTVAREQGMALAPEDVVMGQGSGEVEVDGLPALAAAFLSLLRLAGSIRAQGLINPITVVKRGHGHYVIEAGERRWLATHALSMWGDGRGTVPAIVADGVGDVWRQAEENTARAALNAVSLARQLALLIMASREGMDGQTYDSYEVMVLPGECDRRYYAQVANGNIHKIPRGYGEKIGAAMGMSVNRLSQYRRLLKLTEDEALNDALWLRADIEDWTENALREVVQAPVDALLAVVNRRQWGLDDLLATLTPVKVTPPTQPLAPVAFGPAQAPALPPAHGQSTLTPVKVQGGAEGKTDGFGYAIPERSGNAFGPSTKIMADNAHSQHLPKTGGKTLLTGAPWEPVNMAFIGVLKQARLYRAVTALEFLGTVTIESLDDEATRLAANEAAHSVSMAFEALYQAFEGTFIEVLNGE